MKKLFYGGIYSPQNDVGKTVNCFSLKKVYATLLLMLLGMVMPQKGWADFITTTYDFAASVENGNTTTEYSSNTIRVGGVDCFVFSTLGNVQDPGRFASQNTGMILRSASSSSGTNYGLCETGISTNQYRTFVINNLFAGDVVTVNGNTTFTVTSGNATANGNKFTMTGKGALGISLAGTQWIYSITIQHDNSAAYEYDPAVEIYNLSGINGSLTATNSAGFTFRDGGFQAYILDSPAGYSLNNRIILMTPGDFTWANGLKNNKTNASRLVGINNLVEGDRVVITFSGTAVFSSDHTDFTKAFSAAGNVFKDDDNDGELSEGETVISGPGVTVESGAVYTMTASGHLDIALAQGAIITKIEIYGDHQAIMEDRYNGSVTTGYTAYFSQTGQLISREHIVPGGLEVHVGNEVDTQHAIIVSSDSGPVSFVYDQSGYKMARQSDNGTNVTSAPPASGTFYKFMPEVDGYLTVNFKAYNVKYNDYYSNGKNAGNEVTVTSGTCPYYIMVKDANNNFTRYVHPNGTTQYAHDLTTGQDDSFSNIKVTAGNTYYVYGWWSRDANNIQAGANGFNFLTSNCGVAELIDVTFIPDNMVAPLAKWVANGTTSDDNLADVIGFDNSDVHIKKMSANITGCNVSIDNNKLKISNITFADGANPGGTILIKLGDPSNDANPVFAYTIAYDANWNNGEGHAWNFSDNSLKGLKWNNTSGQADVVDYGTSAGPGLLYDEMHETNPDGSEHSDWTFTYRVKKGETTHDPMWLNKYDMEGDNADMLWDTEGLIFNTASNQSCINNEYGAVVSHNGGTAADPDRYVGVLPGGSFTIPGLKVGDRVVIFVGSGEGSGEEACLFNVTGALDAIGQPITDEYRAGGSQWIYGGGVYQYRGAYNFISTGGDMTFTVTGGSMAKLYSIEIYTGVKKGTVDCSRTNYETDYNGYHYKNIYQVSNDWRTATPDGAYITLHYRGKGERLRTPTVLYKSGNINTDADHLFYAEVGNNGAPYIFFKSEKEQGGMFRIRIDDMELGNKYVADYALQNITVGYLEKKNYPYTWDFTDLTDYATNSIETEHNNKDNYDPKTVTGGYDIEFMNNSVGEDVKTVEQWKYYDADGDIPAGYGLQVRNEPFSGGLMWSTGQLYAGNGAFDESFGLSISTPGNDDQYNGGLRITEEGLSLTGGTWKVTIPLVGSIASVYVRASQIGSREITAGVGSEETAFTYVGEATDGTGDKIYAVKGTGEDMTLFFQNLIIKKIAISQDPKTVNKLGYATESRNVEIDPELMGYMTGTGLKAYTVTAVNYGDDPGDKASVVLTQIPTEKVMGPANTGDHRAYIIYNTDETAKAVSILDGGFHLFVPDMHDVSSASGAKKSLLNVDGNALVSSINGGAIPQESGDYTNYLMNYKYTGSDGKQQEGPEAFYRASKSASLGANKAYLPLLTAKVKPSDTTAGAKFAIVFVNEEENTETTSLDGVNATETIAGDNAIYTLSGVKVSKPQKGGIYIKNGKKIIVK